MTIEVTYSDARQRFASLLDAVTENREIVVIRRRDGEPAALISADELASLTETAHLLRSPANASRLLNALARALKGEGRSLTADELRSEVGLAEQGS
jgi:antitoxin YefM